MAQTIVMCKAIGQTMNCDPSFDFHLHPPIATKKKQGKQRQHNIVSEEQRDRDPELFKHAEASRV